MNYRKSFTTDDLPNDVESGTSFGKWNNNKLEPNNLLKLIQLMKIQHELLGQCNKIICQETTKFILKNKPIFDEEKLKLYKLESIKQRLIQIGLYKIYIVENVSFDNKCVLGENTFSKEWNENAKEINKLFNSCIDNNNRYYNATTIYYKKDKKIVSTRSKKCKYISSCIFIILISVWIFFIFRDWKK